MQFVVSQLLSRARSHPLPAGAWPLLALLPGLWALLARPVLPIDETRYIGVAWEMWLRSDYLVPHLNGLPYSHKPPLLFWLINAGWALFGVNDWWPRLVGPLAGLVAGALSAGLARRFWPERPEVRRLTPWLLVGALGWIIYGQMLMFDTLLTASVLLALIGLWQAGQAKTGARPWLLVAVGLGLGLLSKGPVALIHILSPGLLAPLWSASASRRPGHWYVSLLLATIGGGAIALGWALPAAAAGGDAYAKALFLTQTAGRISHSFAHERPWWAYLLFVPALWLPWSLMPRLWRAILRSFSSAADPAQRFLLCWLIGGVLILSMVSGKQPHYALPELPALALLMAGMLSREEGQRLPALSAAVCIFLLAIASLVFQFIGPQYDMRPPAAMAADLQADGIDLITLPGYKDQLTFAGRLRKPLPEVSKENLSRWFAAHPGGVLLTLRDSPPAHLGLRRLARYPYRSKYIEFWSAGGANG